MPLLRTRPSARPAPRAFDAAHPRLEIFPERLPVQFGWSGDFGDPRETGQEFELVFTNGSTPLGPGTVLFFRANYWMIDPSSPDSRDLGGGGEGEGEVGFWRAQPAGENVLVTVAKGGFLGFQAGFPGNANHVRLAENATGADLRLLPPFFVNVQRRMIWVRVRRGAIAPGERFTVRVRGACSLALRNPSEMVTSAGEHAFVCVVGHTTGLPEPDAPLRYEIVEQVSGGVMLPFPAAVAAGVLPTRAQTLSPVHLRISVRDDVDNLDPEFRGTVRLSCTDPRALFEPSVAFEPADGGVRSVPVVFRTPGVHRVTLHLGDTAFEGNPVDVTAEAPARAVLWGDYHNHSWRCDGTGEPARLVDYARRVAGLDWYVLGSHDAPAWFLAGAMGWNTTARPIASLIDAANRDGRFVTFPSFEWTHSYDRDENGTVTSGDGHRIVLARDWALLLEPGLPRSVDEGSETSWGLHRTLQARQAARGSGRQEFMVLPHDLACYNWWDLNVAAPTAEERIGADEQAAMAPLAQVFSVTHGNHESPYESGADPLTLEGYGWRVPSKYGLPAEPAGYVAGLRAGGVYGVAAGGDNHSGRPGSYVFGALTAVVTDDFSRDGIFDALLARHTYATSGHRLLMEWACGGAILGDVLPLDPAAAAPVFRWRVASPLPITRVRVVRVAPRSADDPVWLAETVLHDWPEGGAREAAGEWTDPAWAPGAWTHAAYYLVVHHQGDRPRAGDTADTPDAAEERGWTSPIFFR